MVGQYYNGSGRNGTGRGPVAVSCEHVSEFMFA